MVRGHFSCRIQSDTRLLHRIALNCNNFRLVYDYLVRNGNGKRDERIRALHERGLSLRAIGRRVGLSHGHVRRVLAAMQTPAGEFQHPLPVALDDDECEAPGPWSHWTVEEQARAYRDQLRTAEGPMRELILYRLRHVMPGDEYARLCERIGEPPT